VQVVGRSNEDVLEANDVVVLKVLEQHELAVCPLAVHGRLEGLENLLDCN